MSPREDHDDLHGHGGKPRPVLEPGEQPTADPMVRPGSVEIGDGPHRWTLVGGRQVWPCE